MELPGASVKCTLNLLNNPGKEVRAYTSIPFYPEILAAFHDETALPGYVGRNVTTQSNVRIQGCLFGEEMLGKCFPLLQFKKVFLSCNPLWRPKIEFPK